MVLFGLPGPAQALSTTTVSGWPTTTLTAAIGFQVSTPVTVKTGSGYVARTTRLLRRPSTSTTWTTVATTATASTGKATISYAVPAIGTWYYRLYVLPTTTAAGAYTAARTIKGIAGVTTTVSGWPTTTLTAAIGFQVSTPVTVKTGSGYVARTTRLLRRPSTSTTWTTVATTATASTGKATISYAVPAIGTWYYRLYVLPTTTAAGAYTAARTIVAMSSTVSGWPTTTLTATIGFQVSTPVTVKTGSGYVARTTRLLRRPSTSTTWTTVATTATASTGKATISYLVPAIGTWYYRLYVLPTTTAAGAYTAARTIVAMSSTEKQWLSLAAPSIGYTPGVNRFAATLVPAVTGRTVLLQRYSQGSWVNVGSAVEDPHGVVAWNPTLTGTGDTPFRAYTPATLSLEAAASASATVSLTPTPPPAPKVSIQIAPSVTIGSTVQLDLQGALSPVTTVVVQPGGLPAGVILTVVNGSLLLEVAAGATAGSSVVLASGAGCVVDACGTPYDLEIDLTIAPLSNVSGGIEGFTNPSSDRVASAGQLPGGSATALPDELLVVLGSDTQPGSVFDAQAIADQTGAVVTGGLENIGVYQFRWTTPGDLTQMTTTLERIGGVAAVEPAALLGDLNLSVSPPGDWNDDGPAVTWPFTQLRLQDAWSTTTGGDRAVGILEGDAVFKDHEDLNVTSVLGPGVVDTSYHATHVAGLACAKANGKGVVGAAWGCPVVSGTFAAVQSPINKKSAAIVLQGANDLAASGVGVINLSIGDDGKTKVSPNHVEQCMDKTASDAMQQTEQSLSSGFRRLFNSQAGRDIVWTLSAGNNCASGVTSPWGVSWALPNVITVAATNSDKTLASFSNFGPGVEVAAPGGIGIGTAGGSGGLWSTTATECGPFWNRHLCSFYGTAFGTSMSAPLVAGIAELAESAAPTASAAEIGSCIVATAGTATGNVTQRSPVPSSVSGGGVTKTFTPSIPFDGTTNPIPIVDAVAAVDCAQTGQAKANVLVTGLGDRSSSGNGTDRGDLFAALTAHGFTVQVSEALPPDLSKYGQVWYLDTEALSTDDTTRLKTYVQNGGSAYLTGERPCCTDSDTVIAVINALTSDTVGYGGELSNNHFVISRNPYGITSSPNAIAYLDPDAPGSLTGVSDPHIVADDGSGLTVWAAYGPVDVKGGGKLVAVMDINYLAEQYRSANWGDIVDNIAHFLGKPSGALGAGQQAAAMDATRQSRQRITSGRDPGSTTG